MLPILRIIPVGGVIFAIIILVLALSPPGGLHPDSSPAALSARGALMQLTEHPEWRQFLIRAAIQRADELNRLRDLPDDETGSINEPIATIPVEIGEQSSTELPITAPRENPPVIATPERVRTPIEIPKKGTHRAHRGNALAKTQPAAPANSLDDLFARPVAKPKLGALPSQPATARVVPQ
jgi:hypothetical protein